MRVSFYYFSPVVCKLRVKGNVTLTRDTSHLLADQVH